MYASYESSTAAHVSSKCSGWGWSVQLQFLAQRLYLGILFTLAFRNACTRKLFLAIHFLFIILECNLFAVYCFYCLFAASLHCNCSAYAPMWVTTFSRAWCWSRRLWTERLYILTTITRIRSSPTMNFMVLLTSWWSTISTVLITLAVLPATLDVLLPVLTYWGHTLGSLVLFVLRNYADWLPSECGRSQDR